MYHATINYNKMYLIMIVTVRCRENPHRKPLWEALLFQKVHWKHGGWCLSNQLHVIFGGEKYMTVNRWTRWKCFSLDHLPKLECSHKLFPTQKWYNPRIQNFYNKKTKLLLQTTEGSPSVLETLYTPLLIHSANTDVSTFILSKH
jgi:hypothetical protein